MISSDEISLKTLWSWSILLTPVSVVVLAGPLVFRAAGLLLGLSDERIELTWPKPEPSWALLIVLKDVAASTASVDGSRDSLAVTLTSGDSKYVLIGPRPMEESPSRAM